MKRVATLILLMGASSLCLSAQKVNKVTVAGSWKGSFADSLGSGTLSVTLKQESNGNVSGTYEASSGSSGVVSGDIDSGALEFILTQKTPNCVGSYAGKLTIIGSSASGTYWGDDCSGKHSNGVISLTLESAEGFSSTEPNNSFGTKTSDYVPCMADKVYLFKNPSPGVSLEELEEGSAVTIEGRNGDWFKVRAQSGKVGYINKNWMCKKADYEARMSVSPSGATATESATGTRPPQRSQQTAIPPDFLLAVAWRAQLWTTTTYYPQSGSSSTDCTGSGSWLGGFWNGSVSCSSQYTPAQNIPINWNHYTVYNLIETTNNCGGPLLYEELGI